MPGDRVETVDGRYIRYWEELDAAISASPGRTMRFGIRRGIEAEERDVTPARWERHGPLNITETVAGSESRRVSSFPRWASLI